MSDKQAINDKYTIRREWFQKVQGDKEHPTWKAVLDALHQIGLKGIEAQVIHMPTNEEPFAIVHARITMDDGSFFEDIGYADGTNVPSAVMKKHLLHMAATRAKGRAGRDAINVADAMVEEISEPIHEPTAFDKVYDILKDQSNPRRNDVKRYITEHFGELSKLGELNTVPMDVLEGALRG